MLPPTIFIHSNTPKFRKVQENLSTQDGALQNTVGGSPQLSVNSSGQPIKELPTIETNPKIKLNKPNKRRPSILYPGFQV